MRPAEQVILLIIATLGLFLWGKWRYDLVALAALLTATTLGLVVADEAFAGFGHPAVITVAAILVISRGLVNSGAVEPFAKALSRSADSPAKAIFSLGGVVIFLSAFMNNVGALAFMMPVTIQVARRSKTAPGILLMPLAFCSILGGMITEVGTPPNILMAEMRGRAFGESFAMFDFAPAGIVIALTGLVLISLGGWRLIPRREAAETTESLFKIKTYATEVSVPTKSKIVGKTLQELRWSSDLDVLVIGIVRGGERLMAPSSLEHIEANDVLILESSSDSLKELLTSTDLKPCSDESLEKDLRDAKDVSVFEAIVAPASYTIGRTARSLNLRWRYGLNLVAVARSGERISGRIGTVTLRQGDVLLLQGRPTSFQEAMAILGWLPLADRGMQLSESQNLFKSCSIFAAAITLAATNILPVQIAFTFGALFMILTRALTMREAYASIEWPIIMLLGAMIPLGQALETSGGGAMIADSLLALSGTDAPFASLVAVSIATIILTNMINNAAAVVLMAPIAIQLAENIGAPADAFLMATAVCASCAFLTPVGHQSNMLVMGPAGYRFSDYWRLGAPLTAVVLFVGLPFIWWWWALRPAAQGL